MAGVAVGDRPHPVPLQLVGPAPVVAWELRQGVAIIGLTLLGIGTRPGSAGGSMRWIIQFFALGRKEAVGALDPLAVERHRHLLVGPLERLVGAPVPDLHRPRPVLALRDLALEGQVLERVVLGVDRQPVLLRMRRQPLRQRPRDGHPVALQPQVPVQAPGVVLLDDEPPTLAIRPAAARLGRTVERPLALVLGEPLLRHASIVGRASSSWSGPRCVTGERTRLLIERKVGSSPTGGTRPRSASASGIE